MGGSSPLLQNSYAANLRPRKMAREMLADMRGQLCGMGKQENKISAQVEKAI